MSHLGKLKPSHLYIYDRLNEEKTGMEEPQTSAESTQNYKIQLKDDGLGKYKISPLGYLRDSDEAVRNRLFEKEKRNDTFIAIA